MLHGWDLQPQGATLPPTVLLMQCAGQSLAPVRPPATFSTVASFRSRSVSLERLRARTCFFFMLPPVGDASAGGMRGFQHREECSTVRSRLIRYTVLRFKGLKEPHPLLHPPPHRLRALHPQSLPEARRRPL